MSATPTVAGNTVYFPDWGGWLYAVDAQTGATRWAHKMSDYNHVNGSFSRTSPAIVGDLLIIGDKPPGAFSGWGSGKGGAHMIAVNAHTGDLVWMTQVDDHFVSQITGSAVVHNDIVYVGTSSGEEVTAAIVPGYVCCTFRGSVVALDVHTGTIVWKTYMLPTGYSGNAVWGSTPAIDPVRGLVYVGTGNNYSVPPSVDACQEHGGKNCTAPGDLFDSLVAMDLKTGAIRWATGTIAFDNWSVACFGKTTPQPNCPDPSSPDADFGSGPNVFNAGGRDLVGAGTKGGTYWTLDRGTGEIVWATQVGPGGIFGGIEWGSSVADGRVYVAEANSGHKQTTLAHPAPGSPTSTFGGYWLALEAATGKVLWQQADPADVGKDPAKQKLTFGAIGQTTTANGVVYVGSTDSVGHVYGLDARTGAIRWSFATGGSVASGASVANGSVYWGSGYSQFVNSGTTGNNKVYAFSLPADEDNQ